MHITHFTMDNRGHLFPSIARIAVQGDNATTKLQFSIPDMWEGLTAKIKFKEPDFSEMLDAEKAITLLQSVTNNPSVQIQLLLFDGNIQIAQSTISTVTFSDSFDVTGTTDPANPPSVPIDDQLRAKAFAGARNAGSKIIFSNLQGVDVDEVEGGTGSGTGGGVTIEEVNMAIQVWAIENNVAILDEIGIIDTPPDGDGGDGGGVLPPPAPVTAQNSWTAIATNTVDENGRVLQQITDWITTEGDPPPTGQYLGDGVLVDDPLYATDIRGFQGAMGPRGPQGINGNDGAEGRQGVAGPVGPQGPQGDRGQAGSVGTLYRWFDTLEALNATFPNGPTQEGRSMVVGNQIAYGWDVDAQEWKPLGPVGIEGPPGPEGPMGSEGKQGERGPQGEKAKMLPPTFLEAVITDTAMSGRSHLVNFAVVESQGISFTENTIIIETDGHYIIHTTGLYGGGVTFNTYTVNSEIDPTNMTVDDAPNRFLEDFTGNGTIGFPASTSLVRLKAGDVARIWLEASPGSTNLTNSGRSIPTVGVWKLDQYGTQGDTGPMGPMGPEGPQGEKGDSSLTPATAMAYLTGGATLGTTQAILFNHTETLANTTFVAPSSIRIDVTGMYLINFGMAVESTTTGNMMYLRNNLTGNIEGSTFQLNTGNNSACFLTTFTSGSQIQLLHTRITSQASNTVLTSMANITSAYMSINRVG